jgi:hypothetical protein
MKMELLPICFLIACCARERERREMPKFVERGKIFSRTDPEQLIIQEISTIGEVSWHLVPVSREK